jgi:two-component SAPR family response regulator
MTLAAKPLIVSIDDETNILKLIRGILQDSYEVMSFSDAAVALEALKGGLLPELIICDINMPGLDGFELHESIRNISSVQAVPFIFLTALADRQNFRKGMGQGADDYLTKPFSPSELIEAVMVRLERTNHLRQANSHPLHILSMGGASVSSQGTYLQYEAKKVIELLLYMISHKQMPLRLITPDLWWDNVVDNTVHVLINRARKTFEGLAELLVSGDVLELKLLEPYDWDAETFEKAAQNALQSQHYRPIEQAINLYKGSFLPGFDSPWSDQQRSHYDTLYLQLLEKGAEFAPNEAAKKQAEVRLQSFLGRDKDV